MGWSAIVGAWLVALGCASSSNEPQARPSPEQAPITSPSRVNNAATALANAEPAVLPVAPTPAPTPSAAPPTPPPDEAVSANVDPSDDEVVGPPPALADCEERLTRAGVKFEAATLPLFEKRGSVCGAPQAVKYAHGPENIAFAPNAVVTCQLALGLARFETLAQRLALAHFGERIKRVKQGGTYNCRSMARFRLASEHSYGNGIDLYEFTLLSGRKINVLKHFGKPGTEARGPEGRFLRALAQAAFDQAIFSVVVTRYFDELHRDHIHFDMAHYRTDGSR